MPSIEAVVTIPASLIVEVSAPQPNQVISTILVGPKGESGSGGGGLNPGDLPVRYDATQPSVNCLWCAPSGQVVLITGL